MQGDNVWCHCADDSGLRHTKPQGSFYWLNSILHLYKAGDYLIQSKCVIPPPATREPRWQRGPRRGMYERRKKIQKVRKKRRDGPSRKLRTNTTGKKKPNNKWPTSWSKVGKVSMAPLLQKNVIPKKTKIYCCSWVPSVCYRSALIPKQSLKTHCPQSKQDR